MTDKNMPALNAAAAISKTDSLIVRQAGTEDTRATFAQILTANRSFLYDTAGLGPSIKTGANARAGTGTLTAGTSGAIANTSVTANTNIVVSLVGTQTNGGSPIITKSAGVGFTVTSTNALHAGNFEFVMTELI